LIGNNDREPDGVETSVRSDFANHAGKRHKHLLPRRNSATFGVVDGPTSGSSSQRFGETDEKDDGSIGCGMHCIRRTR
jgi:hypothetical protein